MKLTDRLRESVDTLWEREFNHPFVQGIADGTLPQKNFQYFMKQDYLFLIEFSRSIALAIGKSRNLKEMEWLSHLLNETLQKEMTLHVEYCAEIGISREDLLATTSSPATVGYTNHLTKTAYSLTSLATEVAILPCCWSYAEIGQKLKDIETAKNKPYLSKWIALYASEDFWSLATELRTLIDDQAVHINKREEHELMEIFLKSTHYEYQFWQAAYKLETW